jgi:hypothetical protein
MDQVPAPPSVEDSYSLPLYHDAVHAVVDDPEVRSAFGLGDVDMVSETQSQAEQATDQDETVVPDTFEGEP